MDWTRLKLVTPASVPALSFDEAKAHLRLADDGERDDVEAMILAAQGEVEGPNGIGLALLTQTWKLTLDAFPCEGDIALPLSPVQSVSSVVYVASDGTLTTLAGDQYALAADQSPAILAPAYGRSWPATRDERGAVRITFVAGWTDSDDLPPDLVSAIKMILRADYDGEALPQRARDILNRYGGSQFAPA